jgi:hypothetical protein
MAARSTRQLGNACDRCYKLKERCSRGSLSTTCERCERLRLACTTVRPVRPTGRRLRNRDLSSQSISQTTTTPSQSGLIATTEQLLPDITRWLQDVPDLDVEEKKLMMILLGRPENLECYVVSPSFQTVQQRSLSTPLPAALPILKDAYLAFAGALKLFRSGAATEEEKTSSLRYASSAMVILRSLRVASSQDAALCLTLGTALALFAYSAIGVGAADICRYCLGITNPFVETTPSDPNAESQQSYLVLLETMDCLVHRKTPTLRIKPRTLENVDRHIGLCVPLLQYYYDLCVISHSIANTDDTVYLKYLQIQVDSVQSSIETWQPSHSDQFMGHFESAEIVNLLAQARVYRLAGLLVSHRLRYAFGEQDSKADVLSKEIMVELKLAQQITKRSTRCVTLPFMAAAVEIRDPVARINAIRDVDRFVDQFTPVVQNAAKMFLSKVWHERDSKVTSYWFDSISKPCVVLSTVEPYYFG